MSLRIYTVTEKKTGVKHLVKAGSQSQAAQYIARDLLHVGIARPMEIVDLMYQGTVVEEATAIKEHFGKTNVDEMLIEE